MANSIRPPHRKNPKNNLRRPEFLSNRAQQSPAPNIVRSGEPRTINKEQETTREPREQTSVKLKVSIAKLTTNNEQGTKNNEPRTTNNEQ